jgi:hypothetical protein
MFVTTTRLALGGSLAALTLALAPAFAGNDAAHIELHRPGAPPSSIEVSSFSWGASQTSARGGTTCTPGPRMDGAASNQNAARSSNRGRAAVAAPAQQTPPPPQNAACVAVFLSKKSYDAYSASAMDRCAKGAPKQMILLTDGMARYTLTDATVESCGEDSMVVSFRTVERTAPPASAQQAPVAHATISGSD